jgi:hypothetical protein
MSKIHILLLSIAACHYQKTLDGQLLLFVIVGRIDCSWPNILLLACCLAIYVLATISSAINSDSAVVIPLPTLYPLGPPRVIFSLARGFLAGPEPSSRHSSSSGRFLLTATASPPTDDRLGNRRIPPFPNGDELPP